MAKFYGVWKGRETGVFDNWNDCLKQTKGFKDALFSKIEAKDLKEANKIFKEGYKGRTPKTSQKPKKEKNKIPFEELGNTLSNKNGTIYFTDGACKKNPNPCGSGVCLYKHGKLEKAFYGGYVEDGSNNIGELKAIIFALKEIQKSEPFHAYIYSDSAYSIKAITEWAYNWKNNDWKTKDQKDVKNKELVKEAHELFDSLKLSVEIRKVKAHIGEEGNEIADRMAITASNRKEKEWKEYENLDVQEILKIEHNN